MGYVQEARENHVKKKVEEGLVEVLCRENQDLGNDPVDQALRSKMKAKALKECEWYTSRYAECAAGRTLSVVWQCRKQAKELNTCLHQYTNDSILEQMKTEYMLQQDVKGSPNV